MFLGRYRVNLGVNRAIEAAAISGLDELLGGWGQRVNPHSILRRIVLADPKKSRRPEAN
jgi:hypothetical protein